MPTETDIYDFQGVLEPALAAPWVDAGYVVSLLSDGEKFQKARPRIELETLIQGAMKRPLLAAPSTRGVLGENRAMAYGAQTKIVVVTAPDIALHRAYLAKVRNFAQTFLTRMNGEALLNHALMEFAPIGESNIFKSEDGYFATTLLFDSPFSIQKNSLEALE